MFESLQFPSHFHSSIYMDFYVTKKKKEIIVGLMFGNLFCLV